MAGSPVSELRVAVEQCTLNIWRRSEVDDFDCFLDYQYAHDRARTLKPDSSVLDFVRGMERAPARTTVHWRTQSINGQHCAPHADSSGHGALI
jgi:hypothetical protein